MSESNGKGRILSLDDKRMVNPRKANDFITVQQAQQMVMEECAKVHEHYLTQIPEFVARMIQDALLHYGLIKPAEGADIAPEGAGTVAASTSNETADTDAPADVESATQPDPLPAPEEPAA